MKIPVLTSTQQSGAAKPPHMSSKEWCDIQEYVMKSIQADVRYSRAIHETPDRPAQDDDLPVTE